MRQFGRALVATSGAVGVFIRVTFRLVVGAVLLFLVIFVVLGLSKGCGSAENMPSTTEAPWAIQTSSRYYYAKEFSLQGDIPTIRDYWVLNGKSYDFVEGTKSFPPEFYGKVAVIRRAKQ